MQKYVCRMRVWLAGKFDNFVNFCQSFPRRRKKMRSKFSHQEKVHYNQKT